MSLIFIDADAVSTGTGTAVSPYNASQIATACGTVNGGDNVYVGGLWRVDITTQANWFNITSKTGVTIQKNSSAKRFNVTSAIGITSGWSLVSGTTYASTIGASKTVESISWRYYEAANVDANGGRKAFLKRVALAATVITTSNSWFYDSTSGLLTVNVAGIGGAPATYSASIDSADAAYTLPEIEYTLANPFSGSPFGTTTCTNTTVQDVWVDRIGIRYAGGGGYGVAMTGGVGCTVRNCKVWDVGYHSIAFANSTNTNNTIDSCQVYCYGAYLGSTGLVMHCSSPNSVTGSKIRNCFIYNSHMLGRDGNFLTYDPGVSTDFSYGGIYCHTNAGTNEYVFDLEVTNCVVVNGQSPAASPPNFINGSNFTFAFNGSKSSAASYPIRVADCTFKFAPDPNHLPLYTITSRIGFVRCRFVMRNGNLASFPSFGGSGNYGFIAFGVTSSTIGALFESCDFTFDTSPSAGLYNGLFSCASGNAAGSDNWMYLDGCTIASIGTVLSGSGQLYFIVGGTGTADIMQVTNCLCVFAGTTTGTGLNLCGFNAVTGYASIQAVKRAGHVFSGNIYVGFPSATGYADGGSTFANSAALFTATTGTIGVDPGAPTLAYSASDFIDPTQSGAISATSAILAYTSSAGFAPIRKGANGQFGSGVGAYEYGALPTDLVGLAGRRRLVLL